MEPFPPVLLGTSSWTASGWRGAFYPPKTRADEYLAFYARFFPTVEIDSTFYAVPAPATVRGWAERVPAGFLFSAKAPRVITHDRVLDGALPDLEQFCTAMALLGDRLGPLLLQFPYFNRKQFSGLQPFLDRLSPFLDSLPGGFQWALEIRNKAWICPRLLDLLHSHGIAFTLIDHPWAPRPGDYARLLGSVDVLATGPFCYVRWLGDRHKIEEQTAIWNRTLVDRTTELGEWAELIRSIGPRVSRTYAYANNHYAGFAPDTLRLFNSAWEGGLLPEAENELGGAGDSPSADDDFVLTT